MFKKLATILPSDGHVFSKAACYSIAMVISSYFLKIGNVAMFNAHRYLKLLNRNKPPNTNKTPLPPTSQNDKELKSENKQPRKEIFHALHKYCLPETIKFLDINSTLSFLSTCKKSRHLFIEDKSSKIICLIIAKTNLKFLETTFRNTWEYKYLGFEGNMPLELSPKVTRYALFNTLRCKPENKMPFISVLTDTDRKTDIENMAKKSKSIKKELSKSAGLVFLLLSVLIVLQLFRLAKPERFSQGVILFKQATSLDSAKTMHFLLFLACSYFLYAGSNTKKLPFVENAYAHQLSSMAKPADIIFTLPSKGPR